MRRFLLCLLCVGVSAVLYACAASSASSCADMPHSSGHTLGNIITPAAQDSNPTNPAWDIPAHQPDQSAALSYQLEGTVHTLPGLCHYSAQGYSIIYDPAAFTRQGWENGDCYMISHGNYLSVSCINGMDAATLRQSLILQENIPDQGQQTVVGSQDYTAHTLVVSPQDGIYRQFWILELSDHDTLLVEQSYVMDGENADVYQALQLAMLDTLTVE